MRQRAIEVVAVLVQERVRDGGVAARRHDDHGAVAAAAITAGGAPAAGLSNLVARDEPKGDGGDLVVVDGAAQDAGEPVHRGVVDADVEVDGASLRVRPRQLGGRGGTRRGEHDEQGDERGTHARNGRDRAVRAVLTLEPSDTRAQQRALGRARSASG